MTDHLALIAQADRELEQAVEIIDVLKFRDKARAIEAMARTIEGAIELQQKATLLRLKAERKAGGWLTNHVETGNPLWSRRMTLADIGVTKQESSRWQLFAALPDDKFNGYVDEHLAKGWDLTVGGLTRYAQNSTGRTVTFRRGEIALVPRPGVCCLRGFLIECVGDLQGHHLISKQMALGNDAIRDWLRTCPAEIMADVCAAHNVGKFADAPVARRILLLQKIFVFGWSHMEATIDGLPWKVPSRSLTLAGMLDAA